jgi:hypothetical protein
MPVKLSRMLLLCLMMVIGTSGLGVEAMSALLGPLPDAMITLITKNARQQLSEGKLPNGQFVPPETPAEQAKPLVSPATARAAIERGRTSAVADLCGLDWVNLSFRPFMAAQRAKAVYTDKQMVHIGMLHGYGQGMFQSLFRQKNVTGCSASLKADVLALLKI